MKRPKPRGLATALAIGLVALAAQAEETEMKPFVMPTLEAPAAMVDMRNVLTRPRGDALPQVAVDNEGHFTADGQRVRFWGVNLCFAACFPPHDVADRMAARLAAFGINCVRFHHMDMRAFPRGIWKKDFSGLDPEALDRLDYLLAALKREGVYADLNLHVSRDFSKTGGPMSAEDLTQFGKVVNIFDPELVELQKKYARELLGRTNKYTGLKVTEDPVVGVVEITNENSALMMFSRWAVAGLSERYETMLARLWNEWLAARYKTDAALRKAWSAGELPRGTEMLRATDFPAAAIGDMWQAEEIGGAKMTAAPDAGGVRLTIGKVTDTSWHLQFKQPGIRVTRDAFYTVRFRARAAGPRSIAIGLQQNREPWNMLGLSKTVKVDEEWRDFTFGFTAADGEADAKLTFSVGHAADDVWLAGVSMTPGGRRGLGDDESLQKKTVRRWSENDICTEGRKADFYRFLTDLDLRFFTGMRTFLRDELGVRAPVTGTEGFTMLSDRVQSHLDFVDGHAYWEHPRFPNRPWDPRDWNIPNKAMVDSPTASTLLELTFQRVRSPDAATPPRPFTVTEYNHPAPNDFQTECVPMLATFAAAQDWDGVFLFAYSHSDDWDATAPRSFFDIQANPVKMVQMAAGAMLFRRGDVPTPAARTVTAMTLEKLIELSAKHGPWSSSLAAALAKESPPQVRFRAPHSIRFDGDDELWTDITEGGKSLARPGPSAVWTSADGALYWEAQGPRMGFYTAEGKCGGAVVGFAKGRAAKVGPAKIMVSSPEFAAVTLSALDGKPLEESGRILITACARTENTGQEWNAERTSVADRWGKAPTLIEPVRAEIALKRSSAPQSTKLIALDGRGKPAGEWPVDMKDGALHIMLPGDPPTPWYVLEATAR